MRFKSVRLASLLAASTIVAFSVMSMGAGTQQRRPALVVDFSFDATAESGELLYEGEEVSTDAFGVVDYHLYPYKSIRVRQNPCGEMLIDRLRQVGSGVVLRLSLAHHQPLICRTPPSVKINSKIYDKNSKVSLFSGETFSTLYGTEVKLMNRAGVTTLGVVQGYATLSANNGSVTIQPGNYATQAPGERPSQPAKAPELEFSRLEVIAGAIQACASVPNTLIYKGAEVQDNCVRVPPEALVTINGPLGQQEYLLEVNQKQAFATSASLTLPRLRSLRH